MKSTTITNLKFLKLKRSLKLTHWQAIGLLEALWVFTSQNAMDGGIGRHSNEDIAAAIEWDADADTLIKTLVETGWLDSHPECRLCVHDWEDHCPNYVKGVLAKANRKFMKRSQPSSLPSSQPSSQPSKELKVANPSSQPPILAYSSQSYSGLEEAEPESPESELTRLWLFHASPAVKFDMKVCQAYFREKLHHVTFEAIKAEIEAKGRDRTEQLWMMDKRLNAKKSKATNNDKAKKLKEMALNGIN